MDYCQKDESEEMGSEEVPATVDSSSSSSATTTTNSRVNTDDSTNSRANTDDGTDSIANTDDTTDSRVNTDDRSRANTRRFGTSASSSNAGRGGRTTVTGVDGAVYYIKN